MTATKTQREKAPAPLPAFDLEARIAERVKQLASTSLAYTDDPEREAQRRTSIERSLREEFANWQHLAGVFADALESPNYSEAVCAAIWREFDELNEAAGNVFGTGRPDVMRLVYPLLRDIVEERAGR